MMEKNVGGVDRNARFVLGGALLVMFLAVGLYGGLQPNVHAALLAALVIAGAVAVATAVAQRCPVNSVLDIDSYVDREQGD